MPRRWPAALRRTPSTILGLKTRPVPGGTLTFLRRSPETRSATRDPRRGNPEKGTAPAYGHRRPHRRSRPDWADARQPARAAWRPSAHHRPARRPGTRVEGAGRASAHARDLFAL